MIKTHIRQTVTGYQVGFQIGNQIFYLQDEFVDPSDDMSPLEYAEWTERQLNAAFRDVKKKRGFCFDYVTKIYTDESGNRMGETGSKFIEAYDEEHAKLLFEKEFPGIPYDEPY